MADNVFYDSAGERVELAYDEVGGVKFVRTLLVYGPDGGPLSQVDVGTPLPVTLVEQLYAPKGYQDPPPVLDTIGSVGLAPIPVGSLLAVIVPSVDSRWRDDGVAPTPTEGMPIAAYSEFRYAGNLLALRFISEAATGELHVSFYG